MDRRQVCVANVRYHKLSGGKAADNLLRYLTFRESRDEAASFAPGVERWTDRGMGRTVRELVEKCTAYSSPHVLLFSLVINPHPDLIAMLPPSEREAFVRSLTERTVEGFFEARGIENGVEWSAVLHHRQTDDAHAPGRHNPHMHVVLPGTYYDPDEGLRKPLYFSQNKAVNHIELLHRVTERESVALLERSIGWDWEVRFDVLEAVRAQEKAVTNNVPHGFAQADNALEIPFWCSTRRTDEQTSAMGYYRLTADGGDVSFSPLVRGLTPEEAELLARFLRLGIDGDIVRLRADAQTVAGMSRQDRAAFFAQLCQLDLQGSSPTEQPQTAEGNIPAFELDL
jgi:hypothetical protein